MARNTRGVMATPPVPAPAPSERNAAGEIGWPINWSYPGLGKQTFIKELDFGDALLKFQRMRRSDETIGAMFWVMTSTLVQFPWSFTPCVDGKAVSRDDADFDQAQKYAQFMDGMMTDMDHSWGDHLEEAVTMAWAGFAPCEIVFKTRDGVQSRFNDGKWGFKNLPLRDPLTVWKFEYDSDTNDLELMRQRTVDGKVADIPVWKLLHYRMSRVLNDPWGVSMLEAVYRSWVLKNRIQESEAIGIERELCGLPIFRIPNSELITANKTDTNNQPTKEAQAAMARIQASIKAVTQMRYNETGGLVIPSDTFEGEDGKPSNVRKWDFDMMKSTGQRAIDARTAARDYDVSIARAMLMQFLYLGSRAGGSFGLADNQSSLAIRSMYALADKIASEFNTKAISLVWMMNAFPDKYRPTLEHGHIHDESIEKFGAFLADMAQAQPMFDEDPALRDAVLDRAGLKGERDKLRNVPPKPMDQRTPAPGANPFQKPPSFAPKPATPPTAANKTADEDKKKRKAKVRPNLDDVLRNLNGGGD